MSVHFSAAESISSLRLSEMTMTAVSHLTDEIIDIIPAFHELDSTNGKSYFKLREFFVAAQVYGWRSGLRVWKA